MYHNTSSKNFLKTFLGNVSSRFLYLSYNNYLLLSLFRAILITKMSSFLKQDSFFVVLLYNLQGASFFFNILTKTNSSFLCKKLGVHLFYNLNLSAPFLCNENSEAFCIPNLLYFFFQPPCVPNCI